MFVAIKYVYWVVTCVLFEYDDNVNGCLSMEWFQAIETNIWAQCSRLWSFTLPPPPQFTKNAFEAIECYPANTIYSPKAVLIMVQRLKRWVIIDTTLGQRLEFAGNLLKPDDQHFVGPPDFLHQVRLEPCAPRGRSWALFSVSVVIRLYLVNKVSTSLL